MFWVWGVHVSSRGSTEAVKEGHGVVGIWRVHSNAAGMHEKGK